MLSGTEVELERLAALSSRRVVSERSLLAAKQASYATRPQPAATTSQPTLTAQPDPTYWKIFALVAGFFSVHHGVQRPRRSHPCSEQASHPHQTRVRVCVFLQCACP